MAERHPAAKKIVTWKKLTYEKLIQVFDVYTRKYIGRELMYVNIYDRMKGLQKIPPRSLNFVLP